MRNAFTLIELLVVISIIALLIAILLPVLSSTRETAIRVNCASHQRQLGVIVTAYATDDDGNLPNGGRDNEAIGYLGELHPYEHTPFISSKLHTYILDAAGASGEPTKGSEGFYDTGTSEILDCPSFTQGFQDEAVRFVGTNRIGWVIGYQYLGGHPAVEAYNRDNPIPGSNNGEWKSMLTLSDSGNGEIFADYNSWTLSSWVFVSHTERGALNIGGGGRAYVNTAAQGARPETVGAVGGNTTYLDGSVLWKPLSEMNEHHSIETNANFPAYW
ncbi:MAG: prepilin-type N-terminal cleavage/methylation domain-containing protein [Planctomycetota bacterium]